MLKRRKFLKAVGAALATGISVFSTRRAFSKSEGMGAHGHKAHSQPEGHAHMPMAKYPPIAWADPNIAISPPPRLVGSQMGTVHTLNVPPLGYEMDGDVKVFTLIAQPVKRFFTEGRMPDESFINPSNRFTGGMRHMHEPKEVKLWGYNGSVPGPTIEVIQGDRVRMIMKNELPEPTSIHWHGLEVPNEMDGAGGVTQPPTPPRSSFIYEFTVHQVGTFMYHTGFNMMKQDGMGLGGFFVIHPQKPKHKIDRDFAIMLQAFALLPGNDRPNLVTMDFNWFTFNGKVAPDIEVMTVKRGDRVRIRFANLTMSSHPIHLHGHTWKVVGTEGGPIPKSAQWPGNTVNVPPGTTRDVEFIASNPGVWRLHCHKLHHVINAHADIPMGTMPRGGMFTFLRVV
jgi:FtsP/CotA-like multicopper oxidase with cupredoxin domain